MWGSSGWFWKGESAEDQSMLRWRGESAEDLSMLGWRAASKLLLLKGHLFLQELPQQLGRVEEGVRHNSSLTLAGHRGSCSRGVLRMGLPWVAFLAARLLSFVLLLVPFQVLFVTH